MGRILVACEFSGVVREAFRRHGHDAWSCDLLPTEIPGPHIQGSVLNHLSDGWDLMIAHPPCTFLTNAGVRWLYKNGRGSVRDPERWEGMQKGAEFFLALANAPVRRKCLENPIMHSYAREIAGMSPTQTIQPWMFGHAETKATCLYLFDLPLLVPTDIVQPDYDKFPRRVQKQMADGEVKQGRSGNGYAPRVHYESPGPERWKNRSRTLPGIADAMAAQWGKLLL